MRQAGILHEARPRLEAALGKRLRGIVLYGSCARGDATADSDIDLMVLLDDPIELAPDLRRIVHALYPLQLQVDQPIHFLPASVADFEAQQFSLYRNVKREGVVL